MIHDLLNVLLLQLSECEVVIRVLPEQSQRLLA